MDPHDYFSNMEIVNKKRYDALRAFFFEKRPAEEVASTYGYSLSAFYSLTRDFRSYLKQPPQEDMFFKEIKFGRKETKLEGLEDMIIGLRKHNFSIEDIVGIVNAKDYNISYGYVYRLLAGEGFARLPRRSRPEKNQMVLPTIAAPIAGSLDITDQRFHSNATGIFTVLPIIRQYGIDQILADSPYPGTKNINKVSSILSFVALKLSDVKRYSDDDMWCMDRGLGLFAGLNVLPKSAWLSSYSSRITKEMNMAFLKSMHQLWMRHALLSDTCNLDFTTIPYWGDDSHLENNWSGKRNKALSSMLAVLAQDPDSGIIDYGNCDVQHKNESAVVLEYLDFYRQTPGGKQNLNYLVFDSKFTNYENLSKLDDGNIKFITIRRRGKKILEQIAENHSYKTIRVEASGLKKRTLKVRDEHITLRGYSDSKTGELKPIRQITITGHGEIKPALIITNDFDTATDKVVRKYSRRWLIEKGISEQIEFFHLNRVCSSMVIKVDFDLTMTLLAHNIYRLFALDLERYAEFSDERIYEKFIANNGNVEIEGNNIQVELKKKRDLPQTIEMMKKYADLSYGWLGNRKLIFYPSSTT
ncbi:MAG: transposase [Candidatus Saccharimonadales bacterium]